jgi:uncharacterized coiled-coil protein SlyX
MNLPNDIGACHALILEQQKQINMLRTKMADLGSRLNKNSQNSSNPPSSEGLKKPPVQPAFSRKKGKKRGGQKGQSLLLLL